MQFDDDALIPDPKVWKAFGVTSMTGHRWTRNPALKFPQPIQINGRNFRQGRELNQFLADAARESLARRGQRDKAAQQAQDAAS